MFFLQHWPFHVVSLLHKLKSREYYFETNVFVEEILTEITLLEKKGFRSLAYLFNTYFMSTASTNTVGLVENDKGETPASRSWVLRERQRREAEPGDALPSVSSGPLLRAILSSLCACPSPGLADHEGDATGPWSVPDHQHLLPHDKEASELP